ncbi:MAG: hypothetical protein JW723_07525 [Bacteroidales bacterium]|nr:hypothetical protein [Bacteroidales bacterium]
MRRPLKNFHFFKKGDENILLFTAVTAILVSSGHLSAQQISRDVVVVKPYEPALSDAYKISPLPRIEDSAAVSPTFDYSILPLKINAPFVLKPINAAKMIGTPLERLYNSYIKLGIGNYFTPVAEYNINSLRAKDRSIGAYFRHRSSGSKITLDNDDKVPAGYSVNQAEIYGKKFYPHADLSGSFRFRSDGMHYYGYNTLLFPDTLPDIKGKEIKQNYVRAGIEVRYYSTYTDSSHLNYDLVFNYSNFNDKFNHFENLLLLGTALNKRYGEKLLGVDLGFRLNHTSKSIDSAATTLVSVSPYFSKKNADYEFEVGGRVFFSAGNQKNTFFYPRANLKFSVVERMLVPYVGIDGHANLVTYERLSEENPYIMPASSSEITNRLFVYAGITGLFSSKSGFNLKVSYNIINNTPLFVNDSAGKYQNRFKVISDDVELLKYSGEVFYNPLENLELILKGNLFGTTMSTEAKAWHNPDYEFVFQTRYNLKKKIYADININLIGIRYAKPYDIMDNAIRLDPVFDLNLGLEYRYSKVFSVFADIYNLTSSKYDLWNQYPARKINFILGFTYKL